MIVIKNKHVGEALRRDVVFVWHAVIALTTVTGSQQQVVVSGASP